MEKLADDRASDDPDSSQDLSFCPPSEVTESLSDVVQPQLTYQFHREIPQCRQHLRARSLANTRPIFSKRFVTDIMFAIFNRPMASNKTHEILWRCLFGKKTRDVRNGFSCLFFGFQIDTNSFDTEGLSDEGEACLMRQSLGQREASRFQTTVTLRRLQRGKKPRSRGLRVLVLRGADCL